MNDTISTLVESIFEKRSLDDCSLKELQNAAIQYPYFTPVQLLLAKKLRSVDDHLYKEQLQKLSIQFGNPLWLDYLLSDDKTEMSFEEIKEFTGKEIPVSQDKQEEETADQKDEALQLPEPADLQINSEPLLTSAEEKTAVEELSFEPYHTVDYFASQGIKLVQEEKPTDHLGQQLKSFTEWLKTLKRLPQAEIEKNIDTSSEEKVLQLADKSITEGEVVTETMAEVWLKQGDKEKAIGVYNKLSLLNPSKSAYFAAKIDQLKEH